MAHPTAIQSAPMTVSHPSLSFLAPLALLWLAQVATPGPNFVRISHAALAISRPVALATATGTALGNALWCAAAALGAASAINDGAIGRAVWLIGVGYLVWLGTNLLARAVTPAKAPAIRATSRPGVASKLGAVRAGVATALTNPQAALFFATYFVTTMPKGAAAPEFVAAIVTVPAVTLLWYLLVVSILVQPRAREIYLRLRPAIDATFGLFILAVAYRAFMRG